MGDLIRAGDGGCGGGLEKFLKKKLAGGGGGRALIRDLRVVL